MGFYSKSFQCGTLLEEYERKNGKEKNRANGRVICVCVSNKAFKK